MIVRRRIYPDVQGGKDVIVVRQEQDVEPIFKVNHEMMMANGVGRTSFWQGREYVKIAQVPMIWLDQLAQKGLKYWDPDDWKIIKRLLNSNEFEKLRTAPGRF